MAFSAPILKITLDSKPQQKANRKLKGNFEEYFASENVQSSKIRAKNGLIIKISP